MDAAGEELEELRAVASESEQIESELREQLDVLESDIKDPRMLSLRRAERLFEIIHEVEAIQDLPDDEVTEEDIDRLGELKSERFDEYRATMTYLKGLVHQFNVIEAKNLNNTVSECKNSQKQCIDIFTKAHTTCLTVIAKVSKKANQDRHWEVEPLEKLDRIQENEHARVLKAIRKMLVAHDMLDQDSLFKVNENHEIMMNMDWMVILSHRALDAELEKRTKAAKKTGLSRDSTAMASGDSSIASGAKQGASSTAGMDYGNVLNTLGVTAPGAVTRRGSSRRNIPQGSGL